MNERVNDRRELIPYAASYPVQVQAAGRQLSIASQLKQDIERGRLVAILKRISSKDAVAFISTRQALDGDLIERFENSLDWARLSENEALPWSIELIERFADRWKWLYGGLSENMALPWSLELLERFENRWDWDRLPGNKAVPWSIELLERFEHRLFHGHFGGARDVYWLEKNSSLPWSLELLERFENRWNWTAFHTNEALPWSQDLLERFEDRWYWQGLSGNKALPWSFELLERFENRWNWGRSAFVSNGPGAWSRRNGLSVNESLPWSLELLERFENRWDWFCLSTNEALPWSIELLERFKDRWDWGNAEIRARDKGGLSTNEALPWSQDFFKRFVNLWNATWLSGNKAVPWSLEVLQDNEDCLNWNRLSQNEGLPWSLELLERFENRWNWKCLAENKALPWSIELLERFENRWNWGELSVIKALPWSIELLERFENRWDWGTLSQNEALRLPMLRPVDIAAIMSHHFTDGNARSVADGAVSNRARRMMPALSQNTRAILLLTAPLITGHVSSSSELLTPSEYKRLARHLYEIQRQPADLVLPDASELLRACQPVVEESRLQRLLGRGFLLSQVIKQWQARAIWVISRADAEYPRRLKTRLREDTPAVLYGCGDIGLLDSGGMAVVGTRDSDESLLDYTMAVGKISARAHRTIVSGGAKGIDQAAMRGALEAGGKVCSVLADSLEKTTLNRENRNLLLDGQLVLISPYDPCGGFNVGKAMQRNKLIYALADASLVVSSDLDKGGTWCGAVEQLDKLKFVPVYVRSTGESSVGLDALRGKGAIPWPNPQDADEFENVFNMTAPVPT